MRLPPPPPRSGIGRGPPRSGGGRGPPPPPRSGSGRGPPPPPDMVREVLLAKQAVMP